MTQATARPWRVSRHLKSTIRIYGGSNDIEICIIPLNAFVQNNHKEANAALIVRAVNHHDELVEMLKSLFEFIENDFSNRETGPDEASCRDCTHGTTPDHLHKGLCAYHRARALLARIEQDSAGQGRIT